MKNISNITYLVGQPLENTRVFQPFDELVCEFFNELSQKLRKDKEAALYPDVLTFAFNCRRGNIDRLKMNLNITDKRVGRGIVFHVAPSNVPVNFAFSYLFGCLAGNANIVRVSSKDFPQVNIICRVINDILQDEKYQAIKDNTAIVKYDRDKEINDALSAMANVRIIWGGDATIAELRKSPIKSRCTEVTFADRYSFGVFDVKAVLDADEDTITKLANNFYNDTYLMDQNACSTPHMIFWKNTESKDAYEQAQKRFWSAVYTSAQKYDLADIKVSDKYVALCKAGIDFADLFTVDKYENYLYVLTCKKMPEDICQLRGKYGMFYQREISSLDEICPVVNETIQTCVAFGVDEDEIRDMVIEHGLMGIDRVVPVGKSLDIGVIWDGYDLTRQLSRIIG